MFLLIFGINQRKKRGLKRMKFFKTIQKNLKILFRMKTSLLMIILGPLLIVFLIGFAFNSPSAMHISIGYYNPSNSSLALDFVDVLNEEYQVDGFSNEEKCQEYVEKGLLHVCIVFPQDFSIDNNKQEAIQFHVDTSRVNIVYQIIDSVSEQIDIKTTELSKSYVEAMLGVLENIEQSTTQEINSLKQTKEKISQLSQESTTISSNLQGLSFSTHEINISFHKELDALENYTFQTYNAINIFYADYSSSLDNTTKEELLAVRTFANTMNSASKEDIVELNKKLTQAITSLEQINTQMSTAQTIAKDSQTKITALTQELKTIQSTLEKTISSLEKYVQLIQNIEITYSETIANPVTTEIKPVASHANNLMVLFPYLVMLIILFVGIMLSSTLVVIEKTNKERFRVFTTPTKESFFFLTTAVTSLLIILAQIIITFIITQLVFVDMLSGNILSHSIIILLASIFFTLLGIAIGYLCSSQQAVNMATIFVGAILLFISNMVLPLESVSESLQLIAQYNPYVIFSELFRQSLLFSTPIKDLLGVFTNIFIYISILIIFILIIQNTFEKNFFKKRHKPSSEKKPKEFLIQEKNILDEKDLFFAVKKLTDAEYILLVRKQRKELKRFLRKKLRYISLSKQFYKMDKKEFLRQLRLKHDTHIEKLKKLSMIHFKKNIFEDNYSSKESMDLLNQNNESTDEGFVFQEKTLDESREKTSDKKEAKKLSSKENEDIKNSQFTKILTDKKSANDLDAKIINKPAPKEKSSSHKYSKKKNKQSSKKNEDLLIKQILPEKKVSESERKKLEEEIFSDE